MNALILAGVMLFGIVCFLAGGMVGAGNLNVVRLRMFRSLDHLIGMIEEITAITHDRRIAPAVVIDQLQQIKYGLGLPEKVERAEDLHPTY